MGLPLLHVPETTGWPSAQCTSICPPIQQCPTPCRIFLVGLSSEETSQSREFCRRICPEILRQPNGYSFRPSASGCSTRYLHSTSDTHNYLAYRPGRGLEFVADPDCCSFAQMHAVQGNSSSSSHKPILTSPFSLQNVLKDSIHRRLKVQQFGSVGEKRSSIPT